MIRPYADLGKYDSDYSKSVAKILQEKDWGHPISEKATNFATDWRYPQGPQGLEWAADLARLDMHQQQAAQANVTATGQSAQNAAGLSARPASTVPSTTPRIKELMEQGADPSAVLEALGAAAP